MRRRLWLPVLHRHAHPLPGIPERLPPERSRPHDSEFTPSASKACVHVWHMPGVRLGKHTGTVSDSRLCVFFGSSTPQKKFTFTSFICCKSTNYTLNSCCQCSKCQTRTFFFFPMHDYHCSLVEDDSFHCGISSRPTVWMNGMTAL